MQNRRILWALLGYTHDLLWDTHGQGRLIAWDDPIMFKYPINKITGTILLDNPIVKVIELAAPCGFSPIQIFTKITKTRHDFTLAILVIFCYTYRIR